MRLGRPPRPPGFGGVRRTTATATAAVATPPTPPNQQQQQQQQRRPGSASAGAARAVRTRPTSSSGADRLGADRLSLGGKGRPPALARCLSPADMLGTGAFGQVHAHPRGAADWVVKHNPLSLHDDSAFSAPLVGHGLSDGMIREINALAHAPMVPAPVAVALHASARTPDEPDYAIVMPRYGLTLMHAVSSAMCMPVLFFHTVACARRQLRDLHGRLMLFHGDLTVHNVMFSGNDAFVIDLSAAGLVGLQARMRHLTLREAHNNLPLRTMVWSRSIASRCNVPEPHGVAADVWALGAVLLTLLARVVLGEGDSTGFRHNFEGFEPFLRTYGAPDPDDAPDVVQSEVYQAVVQEWFRRTHAPAPQATTDVATLRRFAIECNARSAAHAVLDAEPTPTFLARRGLGGAAGWTPETFAAAQSVLRLCLDFNRARRVRRFEDDDDPAWLAVDALVGDGGRGAAHAAANAAAEVAAERHWRLPPPVGSETAVVFSAGTPVSPPLPRSEPNAVFSGGEDRVRWLGVMQRVVFGRLRRLTGLDHLVVAWAVLHRATAVGAFGSEDVEDLVVAALVLSEAILGYMEPEYQLTAALVYPALLDEIDPKVETHRRVAQREWSARTQRTVDRLMVRLRGMFVDSRAVPRLVGAALRAHPDWREDFSTRQRWTAAFGTAVLAQDEAFASAFTPEGRRAAEDAFVAAVST